MFFLHSRSGITFSREFYGTADRFFLIGDCSEVGNVQRSIRTAFAAASQL